MSKNIRKTTTIPSRCTERYLPLEHPALENVCKAGVCFSGISELVSGYQIGVPDSASTHMIIFTLAGRGYFHTDQTPTYTLEPNTLLAVPPGHPLAFGVDGTKWDIAWVYLRDIDLWRHLHAGIRKESTAAGDSIRRAMQGCLNEAGRDPWAAARYAELMVHHLKTALHTLSEGSDFVRMESVWSTVRSQPEKNWTIQTLAATVGCSPSTFQRRIKQFYGTTARQKLLQIRMEHARRLLEHTDFPLHVVADRIGYADEFIFSTAFKRANGMPPRDFRRAAQARDHSRAA